MDDKNISGENSAISPDFAVFTPHKYKNGKNCRFC
jgi:hypothetical protein